jgi:Protein of unknown function (DUF1549)/Protein of unknown function (DUF1553)
VRLLPVPGAVSIRRLVFATLILSLCVLRNLAAPALGDLKAARSEEHWAFKAPQLSPLPAVQNQRWIRNPIDVFILARLKRESIQPSPEADRATLLRRLCLDLIGLPPTPEQVKVFLADRRKDAYERVVDELLSNSHFGERWGRHWLDLARYADSSGYQIDRPRPSAWLYRDWVIEAFNRDLPYDQFTIEQLAGDLLPNATLEQKTAAGFHRLAMMNHEDGVDAEEFRCKAKVDRVSTTGTAWMGLTLGCAECHNHKYDPVSQREFFQIYAFFNNADEVEVAAPQPADPARFEREHKTWEKELGRLKAELDSSTKTNAAGSAELKKSLARHRRREPKKTETQVASFRESTNRAMASVHVRGDFLRKGERVTASTPIVLPALQTRGVSADRLDLARWLVQPGHPLTARVAVNHVWQHLFGRGLVGTPEDFGTRGEPPSHPELLDWLAVRFSAAPPQGMGWSRKALIRFIVTSAAYRQSSAARPELLTRDPLNTLVARQSRLRVESEIIRDLHLAVSGLLNDDVGGPSFRPYLPEDVKKLGGAGAFTWTDTEGPEKYRRGLYIFAQRTVPYPAAMTLDQADSSQSCPRRETSNTPLQALTLLNHGIFVECGQALGRRILDEFPSADDRARLARAFHICLARPPGEAELSRLQRLLADQRGATRGNESAAWTAVAQVLMNLDEFLTRE